jgi:hypothetical protein
MKETTSPLSLPTPSGRRHAPEDHERANRVLLQLVRLAHAMSERERELALVLLQSISAWDGLNETNSTPGQA